MATKKFLFDTSFDAEDLLVAPEPEPAAAPQEPAPPPAPTFSEAELEAARQEAFERGRDEGYRQGYDTGRAEGEEAANRTAADALAVIAQKVDSELKAAGAGDAAVAADALSVAVTIARKLLPEMARRNALTEIEAVVGECIDHLLDEPRVVIRVNDALLDRVAGRLDEMVAARGFSGRLVILADPALGPSDCRVEWADGGAERLTEQLWQDIDRTIARAMGRSPVAPTGDYAVPQQPEPHALALDS